MKTNATLKAPLKKTVVAAPQRAKRVTAKTATEPKTPLQARFEALMAASENLMSDFEMPSWKRVLCAFVLTIAICVGLGFVIGNVLTWLMTGAVMVTGSILIGWAIYILGAIFAAWAGWRVGRKVGVSVLTKSADRTAANAWSNIKDAVSLLNPFSSGDEVAA